MLPTEEKLFTSYDMMAMSYNIIGLDFLLLSGVLLAAGKTPPTLICAGLSLGNISAALSLLKRMPFSLCNSDRDALVYGLHSIKARNRLKALASLGYIFFTRLMSACLLLLDCFGLQRVQRLALKPFDLYPIYLRNKRYGE